MSDFLVDLGANPAARNIIGKLGLPIPLPQKLRRGKGAWSERPLADKRFVVGAVGAGAALPVIAATLARAGASVTLVGAEDEAAAPFVEAGEAWGRPLRRFGGDDEVPRDRVGGLIFDATGIETAAQLRALYDFFHPWIRNVEKCGRVLVIGRPPGSEKQPGRAAAVQGLEGFTRSVAKELGRKGATANLLRVASGAEPRLEGPLRWFLSARSAFVDAQPLRVGRSVKVDKDSETPWIRPLEGKAALVTGAARGIGKTTVKRLAAEGAKVLCLDLPADDGAIAALADEVGGGPLPLDGTAPDAGERIAEAAEQAFGGLDIVVHNAGITRDKTLGRMKPEWWDLTMAVNLESILAMNEVLLKKSLRPGGRVILMSSTMGLAGNVGQTSYAASKSALIGLTRFLAPKLAKKGITVNAVAPNFIETRLTAAMPVGTREGARRLAALSQGGLPIDVAEVVTFFASPGAVGVTGNVLRVCGGHLVGA